MRSKIAVNIDLELLDIIKDVSDSDLDSVIQEALAQFLGVRQIWVKSDNLEPISKSILNKIPIKVDIVDFSLLPEKKNQFRRQPKFVLNVWDVIKGYVGEEFTSDDYWEAAIKGGFNYKESAKKVTILEHLNIIEEAGKIVKINDKPRKYRKIEKDKEPEEELKPEEKIGEIIEHGKDVQERERRVERELLV